MFCTSHTKKERKKEDSRTSRTHKLSGGISIGISCEHWAVHVRPLKKELLDEKDKEQADSQPKDLPKQCKNNSNYVFVVAYCIHMNGGDDSNVIL